MVSTVAWMAAGCMGFCAALTVDFYRKYLLRLRFGMASKDYARIADYHGIPLPLAFEYRFEGDAQWSPVEVEVDEIYHYGADYFLRAFGLPEQQGQIFKWDRIAKLRIRSNGRSLKSVEALLGEAVGQGSGCQNLSSVD